MNVLQSLRRGVLPITILIVVLTGAFGIRMGSISNSAAAQTSQSYAWKNVVTDGGGGFISGIVFNTGTADVIYARTDIGGAYRWNPATNHWIPLLDWVSFDEWNLAGVESIATDPQDPNRLYIAAGTYTNSFTTMNGAILRSSDKGNTFQRTDLPFKLGGNMPGRSMGERLAIDPNNHSIIYFGTRSGNGLWRSADFGATWARVTSFTAVATYVEKAGDAYLGDTDGVVWETFDPRTGSLGNATQTIYAGIADKGNSIFRSTNAGGSWAPVAGQPTGFLPHHGVLSSTGILYVTYSDGAGPYDGTKGQVWKLDTATGVWTQISPVPSSSSDDYFGYGGLSVDAQHPNTLMIAVLNSWWPDTIIFRSTDAGATWTRIWDWTSFPSRSFRYLQDISAAPWLNFGDTNPVPPVPSPKLGWMVGDLEIDPFNSNRMMYGTGATLYGTDDLTSWDLGTPIHITVKALGIEETAVLDLISPPAGANLYSALGDVGGFRHDSLTTSPPVMYSVPFAGSNTSIDYAELTPNFIVRVGNGNPNASPPIRSSAFTFDNGANWFQGNNDPPGLTGGGTVAAAANAGRVLWSPAGASVSFSADNGNSWTASAGIPQGARVGSDRVNAQKFYGFSNGTFYVSTNGGGSFTAAATGLPASGKFKAVPGREGDIWLAGDDGGLWHSTNSGATFTQLANVQKANTIGFGMAATGQTYVALYTSAQIGNVRGIFRSDDAGASWIRINDDQHQYASTNAAITGDPRVFGRVYVSTNGRGIIVGEPSGIVTPNFVVSAAPSSLSINRGASATSTITIARSGGFTGSVALSASGMPSGVTATFSPASTTGTSATVTFAASATASTVPATVTVTGTGGGLTRTATIALTVNAPPPVDFTLSASPNSLAVNRSASGTSTVTISRTGGFAGSVGFTASGLPSGVTATFNPGSSSGTSTVVTLAASSTAATGPATVTVTGTSGALVHTTTIALTVNAPPPVDFTLSANPASVTVNRGASGTSTVTITRTGGFAGSVAMTASGLPAGVSATFNPATTTGTSTMLTLAGSATATLGNATVTVTGTSGALVHTAAIAVSVGAGGGGTGGVTVTPVVTSSGPFFNEEQLRVANTAGITSLSLTIVVQRTTGISFSGQYNTIGGQIVQSTSSTATTVTYQFSLAAGQTLGVGTNWTFAAQTSGSGTVHPTAGDTFTVTYTTGGTSFTQTGHF